TRRAGACPWLEATEWPRRLDQLVRFPSNRSLSVETSRRYGRGRDPGAEFRRGETRPTGDPDRLEWLSCLLLQLVTRWLETRQAGRPFLPTRSPDLAATG